MQRRPVIGSARAQSSGGGDGGKRREGSLPPPPPPLRGHRLRAVGFGPPLLLPRRPVCAVILARRRSGERIGGRIARAWRRARFSLVRRAEHEGRERGEESHRSTRAPPGARLRGRECGLDKMRVIAVVCVIWEGVASFAASAARRREEHKLCVLSDLGAWTGGPESKARAPELPASTRGRSPLADAHRGTDIGTTDMFWAV